MAAGFSNAQALRVLCPALPRVQYGVEMMAFRRPWHMPAFRYSLRFMTVGRDVNAANPPAKPFFRMTNRLTKGCCFHPSFSPKPVTQPVAISFPSPDLVSGPAINKQCAVTGEDARHSLDHAFEPLVEKQPKLRRTLLPGKRTLLYMSGCSKRPGRDA